MLKSALRLMAFVTPLVPIASLASPILYKEQFSYISASLTNGATTSSFTDSLTLTMSSDTTGVKSLAGVAYYNSTGDVYGKFGHSYPSFEIYNADFVSKNASSEVDVYQGKNFVGVESRSLAGYKLGYTGTISGAATSSVFDIDGFGTYVTSVTFNTSIGTLVFKSVYGGSFSASPLRTIPIGGGGFTPSAVPLPASAPMFGVSLIALGAAGYAAQRKKAVAA